MTFKFVPPSAEELAARGVAPEKTNEAVETSAEKAKEVVKTLTEKLTKTTRKKSSSAS